MTLLGPTRAPLDRCELELRAARPNDPALLPALLDEVLRLLAENGLGPTAALAVAGQVVRGTPWAGYRHGRGRFAQSRAAGGRLGLLWTAPRRGSLVDIVACGPATDLQPAVDAQFAAAADGGRLLGVRVLQGNSPRTSIVFLSATDSVPLAESPLDFERPQ